MSELSELLRQALPKGWSGRQVSREAEAKGFRLSPATANNYLGGRHGVPDDGTIAAFAAVLPLSDRAIRQAAGVSSVGSEWEPPSSARYLSADQRRALSLLISTMTEREEVGNDERSAPTKQELDQARRAGRRAVEAAVVAVRNGDTPPPPATYDHPALSAAYAEGWAGLEVDGMKKLVTAYEAATDLDDHWFAGNVEDLDARRGGPAATTKKAARHGQVPANPLDDAGEHDQGEAPDGGA